MVLRILVHNAVVGALLGKGGSVIREIQNKSGAKMQIGSDMLPYSSEKAVSITGGPSVIRICSQDVCQRLLEVVYIHAPMRLSTNFSLFPPSKSYRSIYLPNDDILIY
jgi:hypothetical protein